MEPPKEDPHETAVIHVETWTHYALAHITPLSYLVDRYRRDVTNLRKIKKTTLLELVRPVNDAVVRLRSVRTRAAGHFQMTEAASVEGLRKPTDLESDLFWIDRAVLRATESAVTALQCFGRYVRTQEDAAGFVAALNAFYWSTRSIRCLLDVHLAHAGILDVLAKVEGNRDVDDRLHDLAESLAPDTIDETVEAGLKAVTLRKIMNDPELS